MTPEALHIQGTNGHTHSYIKNKVDTIISFEWQTNYMSSSSED